MYVRECFEAHTHKDRKQISGCQGLVGEEGVCLVGTGFPFGVMKISKN